MNSFVISQSDKRPMYLQIMEQIKQHIAVGDWTSGQQIPSIRQLAVDLQVSVITVKRAYLELEREGVILTRHGKGSHVAEGLDLGTQLREAELSQHLDQAAKLGEMLDLDGNDLEQRLRSAVVKLGDKLVEKELQ
jgi:GntR family transcriptional regulator